MREIYEQVLKHYGGEHQVKKTIEESKELRLELIRDLRGFGNREAIKSEIADNQNMMDEMIIYYGFTQDEILTERVYKMDRTLNRMKKEVADATNRGNVDEV